MHDGADVASKWIGLGRPVEVPERRREAVEMVFRRVVVTDCDQSGLRQLRDALVDFGNGLRQLLLAPLMGRQLQLPLHLDARQLQ